MLLRRREFLGAVLGAAALTGCTTRQDGTPRPVPARVRLGVAEYRPYAFRDGQGRLTGEVVEVARAVCGALGRTMTVSLLRAEQVLPGIEAGDLDVVGGLSIRAANCARVDFSVPDHLSPTALVVPAGNPKKIGTLTDVVSAGARLAVVEGSLEVAAARVAGVTDVQAYPSSRLMLRALTGGQADCAAYDDITLRDLLRNTPGLELGPPFEPPGGAPRYGFGFRRGDGLRTAFDDVLRDLHADGGWLRVTTPFGFTQANIPATENVRDKACAR